MRAKVREAFRDIFDALEVVQHGHFVLNSGRHSDTYINKYVLFRRPTLLQELCALVVEFFLDELFVRNIEVIVGPESGGAKLAQALAIECSGNRFADSMENDDSRDASDEESDDDKESKEGDGDFNDPESLKEWLAALTRTAANEDIQTVYPFKSKDGIRYELRAGDAEFLKGKRVLIVDDVVTSADTIQKIIALVKEYGAIIEGIFVIWDRSITPQGCSELDGLGFYHIVFDTVVGMKQWGQNRCPLCKLEVPIDNYLGRGGAV